MSLFEESKQRGVRNLLEATEITDILAEVKKKDKQGVRGDGKNLLKDESSQKAG